MGTCAPDACEGMRVKAGGFDAPSVPSVPAAQPPAESAGKRAPAFAAAFGGSAAAFLLLHVRGWEHTAKALMPVAVRKRAEALAVIGKCRETIPQLSHMDPVWIATIWNEIVVPRVLTTENAVVTPFMYRPMEFARVRLKVRGRCAAAEAESS